MCVYLSVIFHTHRRIQLHLFVIYHTSWNTAPFVCQSSIPLGVWTITNFWSCIPLSAWKIINIWSCIALCEWTITNKWSCINSFICFCYLPYTQGIQLHLCVIFHTPRVIQLHLSVIFQTPMELYYPGCAENNKQLQLYTPGCMVNNKQMELYSMSVW
jgi:hypothetical protein